MADARPHIAILGAGPTGLEAALAAAEHGFPFTVYEASQRVARAQALHAPFSKANDHVDDGGHSHHRHND